MNFGDYKQVKDTEHIGAGFFGIVYIWYHKNDPQKVYAGKLVLAQDWKSDELTTLMACNHINIVRYVDFVKKPFAGKVLLVTELLNVSLKDGLRPRANSFCRHRVRGRGVEVTKTEFQSPLNAEEVMKIISDCFAGLIFLHSKRVMHRDISSANIMLEVREQETSRSITAKFCDFGLAKLFTDDRNPRTRLENAFYSAPGAGGDREYDGFKADVFSLGVVIAECMMVVTGKWHLVESSYGNSAFETVRECILSNLCGAVPEMVYKIICNMVHKDENHRRGPIELSTYWQSANDVVPPVAQLEIMDVADQTVEDNSFQSDDPMMGDDITARESFQLIQKSLPTFSLEEITKLYYHNKGNAPCNNVCSAFLTSIATTARSTNPQTQSEGVEALLPSALT